MIVFKSSIKSPGEAVCDIFDKVTAICLHSNQLSIATLTRYCCDFCTSLIFSDNIAKKSLFNTVEIRVSNEVSMLFF